MYGRHETISTLLDKMVKKQVLSSPHQQWVSLSFAIMDKRHETLSTLLNQIEEVQ